MSNIKFILPFPPSVDGKYNIRNNKRVKSQKDKEWDNLAIDAINKQNILPFSGRCWLIYELNHPDNYIRDAANYEKKTTDLLVKKGIIKGDERRYVKGVTTYWTDESGDTITVNIVSCDELSLPLY